MENKRFTLLTLGLSVLTGPLFAQLASSSDFIQPQSVHDRDVVFGISDQGVKKPITWGLDLAWHSEDNVRRGTAFMGIDNVNIIRSSFTPTAALIDGELAAYELSRVQDRIRIINLLGKPMDLVLNCDHLSVDPWFGSNAERWAQLMDVTARHHQDAGHRVVTVSPFNEPDYSGHGQGSKNDFYNIAGVLRNNPRFNDVRISGGNTLNNDKALEWYNFLKDRLDEGNTHQLAGEFDTYAQFFTTVRANGHHATNDELHNVMEAIVGSEYGMQTGIWWGTAEHTRSEFVKISNSDRIGYAEHRPNWTAASVYRNESGKIKAFVGASERQASTTTYRYISTERLAYFNGYGPLREFSVEIPGGTGYQTEDQRNAETVINVTYGEDVEPVVNGKYMIMNRNGGRVLELANQSSSVAGANVVQNAQRRNSLNYQCWNVTPQNNRIGGDFSYYSITSELNGYSLDLLNWSFDDEANILVWDHTKGANQQWYLEYAEDGYFFIKCRQSAKCIEVEGASTKSGANIRQNTQNGGHHQQWRFIPIDAKADLVAPAVPLNLKTTNQSASISLKWDEVADSDLSGYNILRSESATGEFDMIARNVSSNSFVDNNVDSGKEYFYKVKSIDGALNQSDASEIISGSANGNKGIITLLSFEENLNDRSENLNNAVSFNAASYIESVDNSKCVSFNGTNDFMQLPYNIANHSEMTIAMWVNWQGGNYWQRIFDFGNGENQNMFLTVRSGSGKVRFVVKDNEKEYTLDANTTTIIRNTWTHISVTIGGSSMKVYKDG